MITCLIGENSFEIERALNSILGDFSGTPEKINALELEISKLPDILMGVSLFEPSRLIIVRELSSNKSVWSVFGDWIPKVSSDIHLVLIESKPDKRTATFKSLKKSANIHEYPVWGDRDNLIAEKWVSDESKKLGLNLDNQSVKEVVRRVGHDQWHLFHALEKLSLVGDATIDVIRDVIELNPVENVFNLFETALRGDSSALRESLKVLEQTEEVYKLSALLFSQAFQLAAIIEAEKTDNVAKDFGIHPYVVSKLEQIARKLGKNGVKKVIAIFTEADIDMKTTKSEPWTLIDRALMKIANL